MSVASDVVRGVGSADEPVPVPVPVPAAGCDRRLDERVARLAGLVAEIGELVASAPVGSLITSATGLAGDVDANLESMMQSALSLQAVVTIAGDKADESRETWQGFAALLRTTAKASPGEVRASVRAGRYVADHPVLGDLWVKGEISGSQVRQIGSLAARLPVECRADAVAVLAEHAPGLTERELAHAARVLLNAVSPGWEERATEQAERASFLSIYPDLNGYGVAGHLTVEQAGWVRTVLDAEVSVIAADDMRSFAERQADALVTILRTYAASDAMSTLAMARPKFIVLTTASDLIAIANDAAPGDFPMSVWGDRVDPKTTRRLLSDADVVPVLVADADGASHVQHDRAKQTLVDVALDEATAQRVDAAARLLLKRRKSKERAQRGAPPVFMRLLTTPVVPLALGREFRIVPKSLRDAVMLRDQHCVVDGCVVPAHRCEIHHVRPWALGGATDIDNLATLCVRHHRTVESGRWRLTQRATTDQPGRYWLATAS